MAGRDEHLPRDAKIVKTLLISMGDDYEPHVIHQFLELWYCYIVEVLTDAQVYSEHARKTEIDCDGVRFAIQSKVNLTLLSPRQESSNWSWLGTETEVHRRARDPSPARGGHFNQSELPTRHSKDAD